MVFDDFNSPYQIDLIDFQSQSDTGYKFVLVYRDHLTKFCTLRPLKCKRDEQIAYVLLDIFCLFGTSQYCNRIMDENFVRELSIL